MRKITKEASQAMVRHETYNKDNTRVSFGFVDADANAYEMDMHLHGHLIASAETTRRGSTLTITDAGWQTVTTKERLNGVLYYFDLGHLFQKNYEWFYMDKDRNVVDFDGSMTFKL